MDLFNENKIEENENMLSKNEKTLNENRNGKIQSKKTFMGKIANKISYVIISGISISLSMSTGSYFTGTITTLEKIYKIPSKTIGFVSMGGDLSQIVFLLFLSYYAGKGHRPKWLALSIFIQVFCCILNMLPHFIFEAHNDIRDLSVNNTSQNLCQNKMVCETGIESLGPMIMFFFASVVHGISVSILYSVGPSYLDDNIEKSEAPLYLTIHYLLRFLGPPVGSSLAALTLKVYVSPTTKTDISNEDPRWIGAWWLGWFILAILHTIFGSLMLIFPKELQNTSNAKKIEKTKPSIQDFKKCFKRIIKNPVAMLNNLAGIFYFLGIIPFWYFLSKYIEIQYRTTSSTANLVSGMPTLIMHICGFLSAGVVMTKFKPKARTVAAWDILIAMFSFIVMISNTYLGCDAVDQITSISKESLELMSLPCNSDCSCDFVKYSPVCSETGQMFVSPCHAGCREYETFPNGSKIFLDCSCIQSEKNILFNETITSKSGFALPGYCYVDCEKVFYLFVSIMLMFKFIKSTGLIMNFLISTRSVAEEDKSLLFGLTHLLNTIFSFLPAPIVFGYLIDLTCLVWGQTCSGKGNCWLYDSVKLRYYLNFTMASCIFVGMIVDSFVWYYSKGVNMYDDKETEQKKRRN